MLPHALETLPSQGYGRPQERQRYPMQTGPRTQASEGPRRFHNKRAINSANMRCHFEIRNAS